MVSTQRVRSDQSRSTGNRRAVRNALFRSLMAQAHRRKLTKADFDRFDRNVRGPMGEPGSEWLGMRAPGDIMQIPPTSRYSDPTCAPRRPLSPATGDVAGLLSPEHVAALRRLTTPEPEPHPLVRLWRRLVWGE